MEAGHPIKPELKDKVRRPGSPFLPGTLRKRYIVRSVRILAGGLGILESEYLLLFPLDRFFKNFRQNIFHSLFLFLKIF